MDIKVDDIIAGKNTNADAMLEQKKVESKAEADVLNLMKRVKELEEIKLKNEELIEAKTREYKDKIEEVEAEKETILQGVAEKVKNMGRNVNFQGIGKAGYRKMPDRVEIYEDRFLEFAKKKKLDKYYKVEEKINKKELNKALKRNKDGTILLHGEKVNDIVKITPQGKKFNWQVYI